MKRWDECVSVEIRERGSIGEAEVTLAYVGCRGRGRKFGEE